MLSEEKFSVDKQHVLNRFGGWADTEPSSPVTDDFYALGIESIQVLARVEWTTTFPVSVQVLA